MNIDQIKRYCLLVFLGTSLTVSAQVSLSDKNTQMIDLGFGIEQSEFLTTAAATVITYEELQQTAAINLADALYGKLLGLNVFQRGGFAGDEDKTPTMNIRGYQTSSEKDILILVDGYERPIDRLTVEEVESVTILKDAAAVALLGHEAINGAILVKTKRGKDGKTDVKVGYSHKLLFDAKYADLMDAYGYASAVNKARANDGLDAAYSADALSKYQSGNDPYVYPNVNWRDEAFGDVSNENQANISISGGTNKMQYYTMLNYTDLRGNLENAQQQDYTSQLKYSKANVRSNVDFSLSPTTKISADILGIFIETNRPDGNGADSLTYLTYKVPALAFPVRTSQGIWGGNEAYGGDQNVVARIQGTGFQKTHQRQLWANAKLTQDLSFWINGLSVSMAAGYDNASIETERRYTSYQYGYEYYDSNNALQQAIFGDKQGKLAFDHSTSRQWRSSLLDAGVHYKTSFSLDDNFQASLMYNTRAEIHDGVNNTFYRMNWLGYFHYDKANKYMADLTLAANGSNRSYPAKWAFSPTLALGWIYANNPEGVLNYGKLRASGGIQHTDYVPEAGLWLAAWNSGNGNFISGVGGNSQTWGSFVSAYPTTDFAQERALKFDLGTDLRLANALDITIDGFYNKRDHILVSAREENSAVVGIPSAYSDVGVVLSYGVEAGAKFSKEIAKNLRLNAGAMFTWASNEYDAWIENPTSPNRSVIGTRVNEAWGLQAIGFFKDQADIDNSPVQQFAKVQPGDVKYKDVNGDDVINQDDQVALGATDIPELNYAFNLGLDYKGFGFNLTFQGTGNYLKNVRYVDGVWGVITNNRNLSLDYYNNSWDVLGDNAKYPRLTSQSNPNNEQDNTIWYQKVNFFKLRSCEIYYNLPKSLLSQVKMSGAKVFVQGQNLFSVDNVDAMDAEVLSSSVYPVQKSVNLGFSVTF